MKRVANYGVIKSVSDDIGSKVAEITEKNEMIKKVIDQLSTVDKTPAVSKVFDEYYKLISEIETTCIGIKYYVDYMNGVSKNYNGIYDSFKNSIEKIKDEGV